MQLHDCCYSLHFQLMQCGSSRACKIFRKEIRGLSRTNYLFYLGLYFVQRKKFEFQWNSGRMINDSRTRIASEKQIAVYFATTWNIGAARTARLSVIARVSRVKCKFVLPPASYFVFVRYIHPHVALILATVEWATYACYFTYGAQNLRDPCANIHVRNPCDNTATDHRNIDHVA